MSGSARRTAPALLHPRHRHLHQARRLSAGRHYLQRRRPRRAGLERRSRPAEPLSRLLLFPFAHGADRRYPHRHRIRRGRTFGQAISSSRTFGNTQPAGFGGTQTTGLRSACFPPRAAVTSRSSICSSSSPASPSASRRQPIRRRGTVSGQHPCDPDRRQQHRYRCQQHPVHGAIRYGVSASIGLDDPTVWNRTAVYNLSIPAAIGADGRSTPMPACMRPTSSATSVSTSPGVCCSLAAAHQVSGPTTRGFLRGLSVY